MKALEKRDNDKLSTDEAKNEYESLIYEFRGWLNEDENQVYDTPQGIEIALQKVSEASDWLDDAGPKVGYKEYQSRSYELLGDFSKLKNRKEEHVLRQDRLAAVLESAQKMKDDMNDVLASKPWITEDEGKDVTDKIEEFLTKVAGLLAD